MVHSHLREILRFAVTGAVAIEANQNKTWVYKKPLHTHTRKFLKCQIGVDAPLLRVSV